MGSLFKCCGKTGKPAVRSIGYIDITLSIAVLIIWILICAFFPGATLPSHAGAIAKHKGTPDVVGVVIVVAIFFVECCLTNTIISAVKNVRKSSGLCDNWIKIRLILLCLFIFMLVYWMTIVRNLIYLAIGAPLGLLYIFYRIYTLFVVKNFQNEVSPKIPLKLPLEFPLQIVRPTQPPETPTIHIEK